MLSLDSKPFSPLKVFWEPFLGPETLAKKALLGKYPRSPLSQPPDQAPLTTIGAFIHGFL